MHWNDQPRCARTHLNTHTCTHACLHTHFLTCFGEEVHLVNFERLHCRSAWCQHVSHYTTNKARGTSAVWHLRTVNLIRKRQKKGCQVPLIYTENYIWSSLPDRLCWVFKMDDVRFSGRPYSHSSFAPQTSSCCNNNNNRFFLSFECWKRPFLTALPNGVPSKYLFCFTELGGFVINCS